MKMSDAFENSQVIDSYGPYLIYVGGEDIAAFEFSDYAKAAAHAINNHDALVELNKELVEALNHVKTELDYHGSGLRARCLDYTLIATALEKAKELTND